MLFERPQATSESGAASAAPMSADLMLRVVKLQVPRGDRSLTEDVWKHLREDAVDGETALRLRRNGVRIGVGRADWWTPVRDALRAIPSRRIDELEPVRLPPAFPLGLEVDSEPSDQTLFFVGEDGVLSGDTWPESRNVVRVLYAVDERHRGRIHLQCVPEVHQKRSGFRYVRTDAGVWQVPRGGGRDFPAAGFTVSMDRGEYLLIAPTERADATGTIGAAFLTEAGDGQRFDTLLFLRPEFTDVREPDK